eukprot:592867-Karenia_brevis.AAC.1
MKRIRCHLSRFGTSPTRAGGHVSSHKLPQIRLRSYFATPAVLLLLLLLLPLLPVNAWGQDDTRMT